MIIPREPKAGEPVSWEWGRDVVRALRRLVPRDSATVKVSIRMDGTTYEARRTGATSPAEPTHPFQLIDASEDDSSKARVVFGMVQNLLPPDMSFGDEPIYLIELGGEEGLIWLEAYLNGDGEVTGVDIAQGAEVPGDTDSVTHLMIGGYSISEETGLTLSQAISTSFTIQRCPIPYTAPTEYNFQWSPV